MPGGGHRQRCFSPPRPCHQAAYALQYARVTMEELAQVLDER
jgi:hypothetical protein